MTKEQKGLTVAQMPVQLQAKMNDQTRKNLIRILQQAFEDQANQFREQLAEQKKQVLEDYKKKSGFDKLCKQYKQIEAQMTDIKEKIENLGLDMDGDINSKIYYTPNGQRVRNTHAENLEKKIQMLADQINPIREMGRKLETRLWMAQTIGEANVIMRQVLGNKEIPNVESLDIEATVKA